MIEWVHEAVLVMGSLLVGFAVGQRGAAPIALWLLVAGCSVVAVWTITVAVQQYLSTGSLLAVYLPGFRKNLIGGALATGGVIAIAQPRWMHGPRWAGISLGVLMIAAIVLSQSRQGMAGVVAGLGVLAFLARDRHVWLKVVAPIALVGTIVALYTSVAEQLTGVEVHNSSTIRLEVDAEAVEIWQSAPLFGVGMRWWYTDRFLGAFQPPSVWLEVGSTVGWFGLAGFIAMFTIALLSMRALPREYATIAVAVIITRLVQSQFDLFWVAGQGAALWLVAGACVGAWARARQGEAILAGSAGDSAQEANRAAAP